MRDPTKRFSDRVADYEASRPSYPPELIDLLTRETQLRPGDDVADIGSGTGKLSLLFLENGNRVYGVEPNREMREAGERLLARYARFVSVDGRGERTGLPDAVVDLVTAGQVFHWLDTDRARAEFSRILRAGGFVVLVWNDRAVEASPFMRSYEALLREYGTDYEQVHRRRHGEDEIVALYGRPGFRRRTLSNRQRFDRDGLRARLCSSSYVPAAQDPSHGAMIAELDRLFGLRQESGRVTFEYETRVYYGRPAV